MRPPASVDELAALARNWLRMVSTVAHAMAGQCVPSSFANARLSAKCRFALETRIAGKAIAESIGWRSGCEVKLVTRWAGGHGRRHAIDDEVRGIVERN
jgi:hypothetical protein